MSYDSHELGVEIERTFARLTVPQSFGLRSVREGNATWLRLEHGGVVATRAPGRRGRPRHASGKSWRERNREAERERDRLARRAARAKARHG